MNNKKLLIINIITLIVFVVVVWVGLNQSGFTKSEPKHTDGEAENIETEEIERVMHLVSLKQSILTSKRPTLQLGIEESEEDEEKDLIELEDEEEAETTVDTLDIEAGDNNEGNYNTNHPRPTMDLPIKETNPKTEEDSEEQAKINTNT